MKLIRIDVVASVYAQVDGVLLRCVKRKLWVRHWCKSDTRISTEVLEKIIVEINENN